MATLPRSEQPKVQCHARQTFRATKLDLLKTSSQENFINSVDLLYDDLAKMLNKKKKLTKSNTLDNSEVSNRLKKLPALAEKSEPQVSDPHGRAVPPNENSSSEENFEQTKVHFRDSAARNRTSIQEIQSRLINLQNVLQKLEQAEKLKEERELAEKVEKAAQIKRKLQAQLSLDPLKILDSATAEPKKAIRKPTEPQFFIFPSPTNSPKNSKKKYFQEHETGIFAENDSAPDSFKNTPLGIEKISSVGSNGYLTAKDGPMPIQKSLSSHRVVLDPTKHAAKTQNPDLRRSTINYSQKGNLSALRKKHESMYPYVRNSNDITTLSCATMSPKLISDVQHNNQPTRSQENMLFPTASLDGVSGLSQVKCKNYNNESTLPHITDNEVTDTNFYSVLDPDYMNPEMVRKLSKFHNQQVMENNIYRVESNR